MTERQADLRVEFLGTGGAITTPRPICDCRVCAEARHRGWPYSRSGPSTFVHGPNILIDTPEEIKDQINRSRITSIAGCCYSHWHPDHVMGRRVWEMNQDWRQWPPQNHCTPIYIPEQVAADFHSYLGTWHHLSFMESQGLISIQVLKDGTSFQVGTTTITPIRLAEDFVYAFLFQDSGRRILVVADELNGWNPPPEVQGVDLAVLPIGIMEYHPLTGQRQIPADHPVLKSEATFEQTLEIAHRLNARQIAFTHFEEPDGLSYDDHQTLAHRLGGEGFNVIMAHDTLVLDVESSS